MKQNVFEFERRMSMLATHWEGSIHRVLKALGLALEETKTAYLYFNVYEQATKVSASTFFCEEFCRVYAGIDILLMSDDELDERLAIAQREEDIFKVAKAYLYKRSSISRSIYEKLRSGIENELLQENSMYRLEGPMGEEFRYRLDAENMQGDVSELYIYREARFNSWLGRISYMSHTTEGWNRFSQVDGFVTAFTDFVEGFKQARKNEFDKKMQELNENGTPSKLVLLKAKEGFAENVEIVD